MWELDLGPRRVVTGAKAVLIGCLFVSIAGCSSSPPDALKVSACSLVPTDQVQVALGVVPDLKMTTNRPGLCGYSGTVAGVGTARLTIEVTQGTDASSLPPGVSGKVNPEVQPYGPGGKSGSLEAYWIHTSPPLDSPSNVRGLDSGVLSATKDGYVVRIRIANSHGAVFPAGQIMSILLAKV